MKSGRDAGCENAPRVSSQLGFCPVRRWGRGRVLPLPSSMPTTRARGEGNGDFNSRGHWAMSGSIWIVITGERMLLASGEWRPGTLLSALQGTGFLTPEGSGAQGENSWTQGANRREHLS